MSNPFNEETNNSYGGILTGAKIIEEVENKNIIIDPFNIKCVNPNSYNLSLGDTLLVYRESVNVFPISDNGPYAGIYKVGNPLDPKSDNHTCEIKIPESGFIIEPGILYIGRTRENTFTDKYIPMLDGRSSGGRLGISVHICAGFGDIGFNGTWTLEITAVERVILYPGMKIAQISYYTPYGDTSIRYKGKYQNQVNATPSKFNLD